MNSDNTPPLSKPTRYTCRNCGFGWDEPSPFCPRCGASQAPIAQNKASTGAMIAYGCGFMFLGGLGACFSLIGITDSGVIDPFTIFGLLFIAAAVFLLVKMVRGVK